MRWRYDKLIADAPHLAYNPYLNHSNALHSIMNQYDIIPLTTFPSTQIHNEPSISTFFPQYKPNTDIFIDTEQIDIPNQYNTNNYHQPKQSNQSNQPSSPLNHQSPPTPTILPDRPDTPYMLPSEPISFEGQIKAHNVAIQPLPPTPSQFRYFSTRRLQVTFPKYWRDATNQDRTAHQAVFTCYSDFFPYELIKPQELEHIHWYSQQPRYKSPDHPPTFRNIYSQEEIEHDQRFHIDMTKIDLNRLAQYYGYNTYDELPHHPRIPTDKSKLPQQSQQQSTTPIKSTQWVHRCVTPWIQDDSLTVTYNPSYYALFDGERAPEWSGSEDARIYYDRCGRMKLIYGAYNDHTPIFPSWGTQIVDGRRIDDKLQFLKNEFCDKNQYILPQMTHLVDGAYDGHTDTWEKNYLELQYGYGNDDMEQMYEIIQDYQQNAPFFNYKTNSFYFDPISYELLKIRRRDKYIDGLLHDEKVQKDEKLVQNLQLLLSQTKIKYNDDHVVEDVQHQDNGEHKEGINDGHVKSEQNDDNNIQQHNDNTNHVQNDQSQTQQSTTTTPPPPTPPPKSKSQPTPLELELFQLNQQLQHDSNSYFKQNHVYTHHTFPMTIVNSSIHLIENGISQIKQCLLQYSNKRQDEFGIELLIDNYHSATPFYLLKIEKDDYYNIFSFQSTYKNNKKDNNNNNNNNEKTQNDENNENLKINNINEFNIDTLPEWVYISIGHDRTKYNVRNPKLKTNRKEPMYRPILTIFNALTLELLAVRPILFTTTNKCRNKNPQHCLSGGIGNDCDRYCFLTYVHSLFPIQTPLSFTMVENSTIIDEMKLNGVNNNNNMNNIDQKRQDILNTLAINNMKLNGHQQQHHHQQQHQQQQPPSQFSTLSTQTQPPPTNNTKLHSKTKTPPPFVPMNLYHPSKSLTNEIGLNEKLFQEKYIHDEDYLTFTQHNEPIINDYNYPYPYHQQEPKLHNSTKLDKDQNKNQPQTSLHTILPTYYTLNTQFFASVNIDDRYTWLQELDLRAIFYHSYFCPSSTQQLYQTYSIVDYAQIDPVELKFIWQQIPQLMFPFLPSWVLPIKLLEFYSWTYFYIIIKAVCGVCILFSIITLLYWYKLIFPLKKYVKYHDIDNNMNDIINDDDGEYDDDNQSTTCSPTNCPTFITDLIKGPSHLATFEQHRRKSRHKRHLHGSKKQHPQEQQQKRLLRQSMNNSGDIENYDDDDDDSSDYSSSYSDSDNISSSSSDNERVLHSTTINQGNDQININNNSITSNRNDDSPNSSQTSNNNINSQEQHIDDQIQFSQQLKSLFQ